MTPEQFVYWLQGIAETSEKEPTEKQWAVIKDHLAEVFAKFTPDREESLETLKQTRSRQPGRDYDLDRIREMLKERPSADDLLIC